MNKNTLVKPLVQTRTVAVKLTRKYGVAVLATTAALVIFSKIADKTEAETDETVIL